MLVDVNTFFGKTPKARVDWSPEALVNGLEHHNIDRALTYSLRGVLYDFVTGNDETWEVCQQHERLIPVATIDPRRHFGCLEEVERSADRGFRVMRFFPDQQGWAINSQPFLNLCEEIAETNMAVMLPAGASGQQTLIGEVVSAFGFPVVICGAGYSHHAETYAVCARFANVFAESHMFNTPGCIEGMAWVAGGHKLMYGSNYPDRYIGASYEMVARADLGDEEKAGVFGENAMRYLKLEGC